MQQQTERVYKIEIANATTTTTIIYHKPKNAIIIKGTANYNIKNTTTRNFK